MFTGLVETLGTLRARERRGPGARLSVEMRLGPLVLGESIAVQGACLTVDRILSGGFEADVSAETLACTTLGALPLGTPVHLERAIALGARMGGHIVSGHVDGRARLVRREPLGEAVVLAFELESTLARYVAPKGSVAVDGVSLTVNRVTATEFEVAVIPHTQGETRLGEYRVGQEANVEVDLLARYVERLLVLPAASAAPSPKGDEPLVAKLRAAGFLG